MMIVEIHVLERIQGYKKILNLQKNTKTVRKNNEISNILTKSVVENGKSYDRGGRLKHNAVEIIYYFKEALI